MTASPLRSGRADAKLNIVVLGLSLSSSWGNGHATTYRALLRALRRARPCRDCSSSATSPGMPITETSPTPPGAGSPSTIQIGELERWREIIAHADAVIVGSYVPDGVAVATFRQRVAARGHGILRHRYAGHPRRARPWRLRVSHARPDPGLRPLSLLHRRPNAATGSNSNSVRPRRARSTAPSIRTCIGRWTARSDGTYPISAPIARPAARP